MQKKQYSFLLTLALLFWFAFAEAQEAMNTSAAIQKDTPAINRPLRIGIFAPLFLDSAFRGELYRYGKDFPRFAVQGLDFVQGSLIALDSLRIPGITVEARYYDTKSYLSNIRTLITGRRLDSLDLIIGAVKDREYMDLANFALQKNIPFISATFPNDGGITANPFTVILNSTLKAHCEGIYGRLLQYFGNDNIILVRRPGASETAVENYFKSINTPDGKPLLNIETVNISTSDFSILKKKMDSTRNTVIIGGTLNEKFATDLALYAQSLSNSHPVTLIGMPNWDGFKSLLKNKKLEDFPIYFTTPYFNTKWDDNSRRLKEMYLAKYKGHPTDMAYKGYEATLHFITLLSMYPYNVISHLNDYPGRVFTNYFFKPVYANKESLVPNYFENKNLYFIKILNGGYSKAW